MPTLETLSRADIEQYFQPTSMSRAHGYLSDISDAGRSGQGLTATVQGQRAYEVEVQVTPAGIDAYCSCPYDWGGYCKHVAAVLLAWIQWPDRFRPNAGSTPGGSGSDLLPHRWREATQPSELPDWVEDSFEARSAARLAQAKEFFGRFRLSDLRDIASEQGWRPRGGRKQEVVDQLAAHMTTSGFVAGLWDGLDEAPRHVFRTLALLRSRAPEAMEYRERFLAVLGVTLDRTSWQAAELKLRGLGLFVQGEAAAHEQVFSDWIQLPALQNLPPLLAGVVSTASESELARSGGRFDLADPLAFVRAINQLLILLAQQTIELRPPRPRLRLERYYPLLQGIQYEVAEVRQAVNEGRLRGNSDFYLTIPPIEYLLPDDAIERLLPVVVDQSQLDYMVHLLISAGLVWKGNPVTVWPEARDLFLRRSEPAQHALLARVAMGMAAWTPLWDMLRVDNKLTLQRRYVYSQFERLLGDLFAINHLVLRILASLPPREWVRLEAVDGLLREIWPVFERSAAAGYAGMRDGPLWRLKVAASDTPLDPKNRAHWDLAQGAFVRRLIAGPLYWQGQADLYWENGQLEAVRFHGLHDLYWDRVDMPPLPARASQPAGHQATTQIQAREPVVVDGIRITVLPSAVNAQAHGLLDRIARLDLASSDRFVYELDARAAYESFEEGVLLDQIEAEWQSVLAQPIPVSIWEPLSRWWQAYGRVRIYRNLAVIQLADDYALAELKAVTNLDQVMVAEVSPRLVVIPQDMIEPLIEQLRKAGYTPKQADPE